MFKFLFFVGSFIAHGQDAISTIQQVSYDVRCSSPNNLINYIPDKALDKIVLYVGYHDTSAFKNFAQSSKKFHQFSRCRQYKNQTDQQHFENQKELLRKSKKVLRCIQSGCEAVNIASYKNLIQFIYTFHSVNFSQSFQESWKLLEEYRYSDPEVERFEYEYQRNNLHLKLERKGIYSVDEDKALLESVQKAGKDFKIGRFFEGEVNQLKRKFDANLAAFLAYEDNFKAQMRLLWSTYESQIPNLKTVSDLEHFKQQVQEKFKDTGLPDPFYDRKTYEQELLVLNKLIEHTPLSQSQRFSCVDKKSSL